MIGALAAVSLLSASAWAEVQADTCGRLLPKRQESQILKSEAETMAGSRNLVFIFPNAPEGERLVSAPMSSTGVYEDLTVNIVRRLKEEPAYVYQPISEPAFLIPASQGKLDEQFDPATDCAMDIESAKKKRQDLQASKSKARRPLMVHKLLHGCTKLDQSAFSGSGITAIFDQAARKCDAIRAGKADAKTVASLRSDLKMSKKGNKVARSPASTGQNRRPGLSKAKIHTGKSKPAIGSSGDIRKKKHGSKSTVRGD